VTGAAVANVPVRLGISVKGFDRLVEVTTGPDGAFSHTFEPGANEAGLYSIWAAHPDVKDRSVQASFAIAGFRVAPEGGTIRMGLNSTVNVPVKLTNFGGAALTGLTLITNSTEGIVAAVGEPDSDVLAAGQTEEFTLAVTATGDAPGVGFASMTATVAEGLEGEVHMDVTTVAQKPALRVNPTYIDTGLTRGTKKLATFTLSNIGYEPLRGARIDGLVYPWMTVASGRELGEIAPGQVKEIGVMLAPGQDVPAGVYDDKITVYSDNHVPMDYYVQVTVTSDNKGSVVFDVLNEFYEDVAGASITIQSFQFFDMVYHAETLPDGTVMVTDIPEGRYSYNIAAPGHESAMGSFVIEPGVTTTVPVAMELTLVDIEWFVSPVIIEDRYEVTISQTFATKVPTAVLVAEPPSVSLPIMASGEVYTGEFKVTNYGLVEVYDIKFEYPSVVGDYEVEVFTDVIPDRLGAMQSVTIPYRITKRVVVGDSLASLFDGLEGYGGDCVTSGSFKMSLKGKCEVCPDTPHAGIADKMVEFLVSYVQEGLFCGKSTSLGTEGQYTLLGVTDVPLNVLETEGREPKDCSYYDAQCAASELRDEYACVTRPCCESFGANPVGNCIRGCLLTYELKSCGKLWGLGQAQCRAFAHVMCYGSCTAAVTGLCVKFTTPSECVAPLNVIKKYVGWVALF
jgi:uncharacterized membrane protein